MRVTPYMIYDRVLTDFRSSFDTMNNIYSELTTGKKFSKPSDNVLGLAKAQDYKLSINKSEQYLDNIDDATAKLSYTSGLVESVYNVLTRIQELTVQVSSGTATPDSRISVAEEIKSDRDFLLSIANNKYEDKFIFSGFKSDTAAFDAASGAYQGDANVKKVQVENNTYIGTTMPGDKVFDGYDSNGNMFKMLDDLHTALVTNDVPTIRTMMDRLDNANKHITNVNADLGSRLNSIDSLKSRLSDEKLILQKQLSNTEDADFAASVSKLQQSQTALTAMRDSAGKIINQTLLDFLR